jgi:hypothetical protein
MKNNSSNNYWIVPVTKSQSILRRDPCRLTMTLRVMMLNSCSKSKLKSMRMMTQTWSPKSCLQHALCRMQTILEKSKPKFQTPIMSSKWRCLVMRLHFQMWPQLCLLNVTPRVSFPMILQLSNKHR